MEKPERLNLQSADGAQLNLDALYQICPSCFTEALDAKTGEVKRKVDFNTLRQLLGDNAVEDAPEAYVFNWVGKQAARAEVLRPTKKTLRPVKEDSVDWDNTQNLYIEGDNLEVLKLLQKSYLGKVKMIYIDPPYNTGNDFVYHDDFAQTQAEYDEASGAVDELGNRYWKNTDSNGKYHSEWCSMIYSRLMVARTLLSKDGVIFISIDDNEQKNLKNICDEVFGANNFIAQWIWEKRLNRENRKEVSVRHDYILCYSKEEVEDGERRIFQLPMNEKALSNYGNPDNDPRGPWKSDPAHAQGGHGTSSQFYVLTAPNGKKHELPSGRCWLYTQKEMEKAISENRIWFGKDGNGVPRIKTYLYAKERGLTPETMLFAKDVSTNEKAKNDLKDLFDGKAVFETPKPFELIEFLLRISVKKGIVIDFFSGVASTAHAVMQLNAEDGGKRKYIMVQLSEETPEDSEAKKNGYNTIPEIAKERIRRAGKKIKEEHPEAKDLDTGFRVFRLDEGNFENVEVSPKNLEQTQLELFLNNIKSDRTDLDLLFGCMLSWGVQLSLPMTSEVVDGKTIYTVNDGDLVACFAENVTDDVVRAMANKMPLRVIFRDSCFAQDADKINIYETFKQLLDWSDQEVIKNIRVI